MADIIDIIGNSNISDVRQYVRDEQTKVDRELSKFYHNVNINESLDMYKGYLVYKELKSILNRRCAVKKAMTIFSMPKR